MSSGKPHSLPLSLGGRFASWIDRLRAAPAYRAIDRIGRGNLISGQLQVSNDGLIVIGDNCRLSSHPIQSHLIASPGGKIIIGDRVVISYGAAISSSCEIRIGDDTRIGPFSVILDNDFHKVGDRNLPGTIAPVQIGRGVRIGARVTLLRGSRIGDGAQVMPGSTIFGVIAAGAVVAGVPARILSKTPTPKIDPAVGTVVMRVFGLSTRASIGDGPRTIQQWTPNGIVRLLVALEDTFRITLDLEQLRAVNSIGELSALVAQARERVASAKKL